MVGLLIEIKKYMERELILKHIAQLFDLKIAFCQRNKLWGEAIETLFEKSQTMAKLMVIKPDESLRPPTENN